MWSCLRRKLRQNLLDFERFSEFIFTSSSQQESSLLGSKSFIYCYSFNTYLQPNCLNNVTFSRRTISARLGHLLSRTNHSQSPSFSANVLCHSVTPFCFCDIGSVTQAKWVITNDFTKKFTEMTLEHQKVLPRQLICIRVNPKGRKNRLYQSSWIILHKLSQTVQIILNSTILYGPSCIHLVTVQCYRK